MKKQIRFYLTILSILAFCCSLSAQVYRVSYTGTYRDIIIPNYVSKKTLVLTTVGGDGGVHYNGSNTFLSGKGAYVSAVFEVGGTNQPDDKKSVRPGGTLRFFVGGKAESTSTSRDQDKYSLGGGGATGIAYLGPFPGDTWRVLMVAGGGSGTYYGGGFTRHLTGASGLAYNPNLDIDNMITKISDDAKDYSTVYARSPYYGMGIECCEVQNHAEGGGSNKNYPGWTNLNSMPTGSGTYPIIGFKGGWGFGPGGLGGGVRRTADYGDTGGGGGGYFPSKPGLGGISHIPDVTNVSNIISFTKGTTRSPENGYASYEFVAEVSQLKFKAASETQYCIGSSTGSIDNQMVLSLVDCNDSEKVLSWLQEFEYLRLTKSPEKCIDLKSNNTTNDTQVQIYDCNKTDGQRWIYDGVSQQIRYSANNKKCLSREKASGITIDDCTSTDNQKWEIDDNRANLSDKKAGSIRPRIHQTYCIDNSGGKTDNGNKIQIWRCVDPEGNNNQKWYFDGNAIRLSNHRDKCLDLPSSNTANGTNLQLYQCNGTDAQQWIYDGLHNMFRSKVDLNKCIDLEGGSTSNGTYIQIWDCKPGNTNMQWTLEPATPNPDDEVFGPIPLVSNPNKCIDLKSRDVSNGANIQVYTCKEGEVAQTWFIQGKQIKLAKNPDYCVALKSYDGHIGDNVHLWQCKDQPNEEWIFDVPFQLIRSRVDANKCLKVSGTNIELATCSYGDDKINQQWTLPGDYAQSLAGENLNIHLAKNDTKCLNVKNIGDDTYGYNIYVYDCHSEYSSQKFFFDGSRIKMQNRPELCVDLEDGSTVNGTNIRMMPCNGTNAQKWMYDALSGRIHSKVDANQCMDYDHASTDNGTNLKLDDCKEDQDAQKFVIK